MDVERSDDERARQEATPSETSGLVAMPLVLCLFLAGILVWLALWTLSEVQAVHNQVDQLRWLIDHYERTRQR